MNNFYPKGAIRGKEQFEKLLDQRFKKDSNLYLVNQSGSVFRIRLNSNTQIYYYPPPREWWNVNNTKFASSFNLEINPSSGYLESYVTKGYVFSNFWHAWAYANHLEQSGFTIDWCFPVGVG
jgi:hypothetical protein